MQRVVGVGVKQKTVIPITGAVADGGNRAGDSQNDSDSGDNYKHKHIKEVIRSGHEHPEFSTAKDRLKHPVNRRTQSKARLAGQ